MAVTQGVYAADGSLRVTVASGSSGIGDVVGPASAIDNRVVRFDGTTGKLTQSSLLTLDDNGLGTILGTTLTGAGFYVGITTDTVARISLGLNTLDEPRIGMGPGGASVRDTFLTRDAANTFAQRNGTTAQAFRVYNTYTDASNYERGYFGWFSNVFQIGTAAAGTGTNRHVDFVVAGVVPWRIANTGHLLAPTDNTYDIGASGATRPRNLYVGTNIRAGGDIVATANLEIGAANPFFWTGRSTVVSPSDGVIKLANNAQTDFSRLQFGGTTSSFPALKRSTTALQAVLADDSGYTQLISKGTATNDDAVALNLGEFLSSVISSPQALTTNTPLTLTTLSLTAGDWDVSGIITFIDAAGGTTSVTQRLACLSTTTNVVDTTDDRCVRWTQPATIAGANAVVGIVLPVVRFSVASTTSIFLVGRAVFTVSTETMQGTLRARRVR